MSDSIIEHTCRSCGHKHVLYCEGMRDAGKQYQFVCPVTSRTVELARGAAFDKLGIPPKGAIRLTEK